MWKAIKSSLENPALWLLSVTQGAFPRSAAWWRPALLRLHITHSCFLIKNPGLVLIRRTPASRASPPLAASYHDCVTALQVFSPSRAAPHPSCSTSSHSSCQTELPTLTRACCGEELYQGGGGGGVCLRACACVCMCQCCCVLRIWRSSPLSSFLSVSKKDSRKKVSSLVWRRKQEPLGQTDRGRLKFKKNTASQGRGRRSGWKKV